MDKILSNITEIYKGILDKRVVFEQTEKLHLFNGAFCKSGSGPAEHLKLNPTDWTGKRAWDMIGAEGTSVHAIDGGTVIDVKNKPYSKEKAEFGGDVIIKTDSDTHYYSNLVSTNPKLQRGSKILQGDFIGKIGKPKEDPNWQPHLHIALEKGDLRTFVEDNCNLKKRTSGITSFGTNPNSTKSETGYYFGNEDFGKKLGQSLTGQIQNENHKLNEITLSEPVPIPSKIKHGFDEKRGNRTHGGIDIPATVGTPIKSIADGQVIAAGPLDWRCGDGISISHADGFVSSYCHLSSVNVTKGAVVKQGQVIGSTGGAKGAKGAGNSQGPHLHLTLKKDGKRVDPLQYINKVQISDVKFNQLPSGDIELPSDIEGLDTDDADYSKAIEAIYKQIEKQKSPYFFGNEKLGQILSKPFEKLGILQNEEKIYGDFGKDQKSRYGSITLPKEKNSKIKSPVSGKVVRGEYNSSCFNQISIEHEVDGKKYSLEYCGIKNPKVKFGDKISKGSTLGDTDRDVTISLFDEVGSRVYIDNYIKKEVDKTQTIKDKDQRKKNIEKGSKLYFDSPWGRLLGSILVSPLELFKDKYDESGELKQKRWSSPTEKKQPDDWISQLSPTYPKKLKEEVERIKKIL